MINHNYEHFIIKCMHLSNKFISYKNFLATWHVQTSICFVI